MSDWVRFHRELCEGDKRGIPRATRFVYLELSRLARARVGVVPVPVGMSDVEGVCDLLGGNRREVVAALAALCESGMVRFADVDGKRVLEVVEWATWNTVDRTAAERQQKRRDEAKRKRDGHVDVTRDVTDESRVTSRSSDLDVTEPRARALISSVSSLQGEGESERGAGPRAVLVTDLMPPPPASGKLDNGFVKGERSFWEDAYAAGVESGTGQPHAFRRVEFEDLRAAVETHCKGDDRRDITGWIRRTAAEFADAVKRIDGGAKLYVGNGPSAMLRWFNAGGRPIKVTAGVKRAPVHPIQNETIKPETPEGRAARLACVGAIGQGRS